jgi:hypothetical protein
MYLTRWGAQALNIRALLQWAHFVSTYTKLSCGSEIPAATPADIYWGSLLAAKFLFFDTLARNDAQLWTRFCEQPRLRSLKAVVDEMNSMNPSDTVYLTTPFELAGPNKNVLRFSYLKVCVPSNAAITRGLGEQRSEDYWAKSKLQPVKTIVANYARVLASLTVGFPLLLEGPPGIGKTALIKDASRIMEKELIRINLSSNTTTGELLGQYVPRMLLVGSTQVHSFVWEDGQLVRALRQGHWILLDEVNLAPSEVLDEIAPLMEALSSTACGKRATYSLRATGECIDIHATTKIFATMNPSTIGGGRNRLPRALASMFVRVPLDDYEPLELAEILLKNAEGLLASKVISSNLLFFFFGKQFH